MTLIIKHITNSSLQFSLQKWQLRFLASQASFIDLTKSLFSFASSFAEMRTCKKPANAVYQSINYVYLSFPLARPLAEIATYKKTANAVFQNFSYIGFLFSFASSFAETQTSANKRKPVYQLVNDVNTLFLCKPSLQKP